MVKKVTFLGILFLTLSFVSTAYAKESSYAFIDVAKVFDEYEKTKDNDRQLQETGRKKEEERDALVHEVRQIKDELMLLSEEAKNARQGDLELKIRDLQAFDQQAKEELGGQRREVVQEIFKDIDDAVQRYGERKAINFIFNERALLYSDKKFDITEDILAELNKNYSKKN